MSHEHTVATQRYVTTYAITNRNTLVSSIRQACTCGATRRLTVITIGKGGDAASTRRYSKWKSGQSRKVQ